MKTIKNILVTGSKGQLGNELKNISAYYPRFNMIFTDLPEIDIANAGQIESFLKNQAIDFLINCAAYTAVDKAESEPELANQVNAKAPGLLASAAEKHKFKLIHISTDYVFNGQQFKPYLETDIPDPDSAYGRSKLAGEEAILKSSANSLIIRTSWLYSSHRNNFVKTILRLSNEKDEIKVVFDQIGAPTYAAELAKAILEIVDENVIDGCSIYHYSNEGVCSWYDFAKTIIELTGSQCKITPIRSEDFPTPAPRPPFSVLDKSKIKNDFGIQIPWWKDSFGLCLKRILKQSDENK